MNVSIVGVIWFFEVNMVLIVLVIWSVLGWLFVCVIVGLWIRFILVFDDDFCMENVKYF